MPQRFHSKTVLPIALFACLTLLFSAVCRAGEREEELAEKAKRSLPDVVRDTLGFEDARLWSGGQVVGSPRKSGARALKWDNHAKNGSLSSKLGPFDLSLFNVMSFWVHSDKASDETFMIILPSTREKGVNSYYSHKITVDWEGWKKIELRFREFGRSREPAGWNKIDGIRFTASGWNQEPTNDRVWVLDSLDFSYTSEPYRPEIKVEKYVVEPDRKEFLAHLRREHPRLILTDDQLPALRKFIETDERGRKWYENAKSRAESYYKKPVRKHELPDGRRLLSVSREVLNRIYHWGFMYRMEGDRKWLDRAWQEMEAVIAFPDWNPSHYLDTAEMMHAIGIGYDWFYHGLTEQQRKQIREGLWQHGLRLSYASYMGLEAEGMQGWRKVTNNWNFVCNGGTSLAAMAVLDEMPEECTDILHAAFQYIQLPLEHFEPDGAWWEGVGYWAYSIVYFVPYLRGLETAFGTDFGFVAGLQDTGFAQSGDFPVYLVSPLGGIYNFADSGSGGGNFQNSHLFYLANRFHNPLYQYFQEHHTSGGLFDLLYYEPLKEQAAIDELPLDKYFRKTEVVTMRSSWTDPDATYVGIKCGKNGIAHAHQDLGSFILYAQGQKWLIDLGTEHQTYLGHQHHISHWNFYRIREEGHNTLVFNPESKVCQDTKGEATISRFETSPKESIAIADLTDAYSDHATSVKRGFHFLGGRSALLVQDEFTAKETSDVWWFAHGDKGTKYEVDQAGTTVTLQRGGKSCRATLLAPAGAKFAVMDATPLPTSPNPEIQNPNKGMQKLAVHLPQTRQATIAVLFQPQPGRTLPIEKRATPLPLDQWQLSE